MNHIFLLVSLGCCVCSSFAAIEPSNANISHYACNPQCISRFSDDLTQCQSDTGEIPECTAKQLGEIVPIRACDSTKTDNSSAEDLNKLFNTGRFKPYKYNTIRTALAKGPLSFQYISQEDDGTVTNIEVIADTDSKQFQCQYNFEVEKEAVKSAQVSYFTVEDGSDKAKWHWGWYFHSENVHIFRSCEVSPQVSPDQAYGSIVVYMREGHEDEADDALKGLTFLKDVKFDQTVVDCV
jgi:hypothetical protein